MYLDVFLVVVGVLSVALWLSGADLAFSLIAVWSVMLKYALFLGCLAFSYAADGFSKLQQSHRRLEQLRTNDKAEFVAELNARDLQHKETIQQLQQKAAVTLEPQEVFSDRGAPHHQQKKKRAFF